MTSFYTNICPECRGLLLSTKANESVMQCQDCQHLYTMPELKAIYMQTEKEAKMKQFLLGLFWFILMLMFVAFAVVQFGIEAENFNRTIAFLSAVNMCLVLKMLPSCFFFKRAGLWVLLNVITAQVLLLGV